MSIRTTETTTIAPNDDSNGYETVSEGFMSIGSGLSTGVTTVRDWAKLLPGGGSVLDVGCGHEMPVSKSSPQVTLVPPDISDVTRKLVASHPPELR